MLARIACALALALFLTGCKPKAADAARPTYQQGSLCLSQDVTGAITAIAASGCSIGVTNPTVVYCAKMNAGTPVSIAYGPCSPFAPIAIPRSIVSVQILTSICFQTDALSFAVVALYFGAC